MAMKSVTELEAYVARYFEEREGPQLCWVTEAGEEIWLSPRPLGTVSWDIEPAAIPQLQMTARIRVTGPEIQQTAAEPGAFWRVQRDELERLQRMAQIQVEQQVLRDVGVYNQPRPTLVDRFRGWWRDEG